MDCDSLHLRKLSLVPDLSLPDRVLNNPLIAAMFIQITLFRFFFLIIISAGASHAPGQGFKKRYHNSHTDVLSIITNWEN